MSEHEKNPAENGGQAQPIRIERPEGARYLAVRNIKIGVKPGYVLRKVGQAFMVMPTGPRMKEYQGIITLNETGAFLFKESQKPGATRQGLIDACKAEYGASDEEADRAVDSFVMQCAECGLFEYETAYFDTLEDKQVTEKEFQDRARALAQEEAERKAAEAESSDKENP